MCLCICAQSVITCGDVIFPSIDRTFMCRKHVCVGVKKFCYPEGTLISLDQKVYKCRDTLVSLGLKVDYTAERFNSLALTGITADTLIALRRERLFICRTLCFVSGGYLRCRPLAAFV